jgi:pectate lyase
MKNNGWYFLVMILSVFQSACAQQKKLTTEERTPIAFPGAEGFGKFSTGGRGGSIYVVSNLNDSGPGSLREALKKKEAKIIVFAISGTIHLESKLNISANTTIAGQTAPGDGICLADYPVSLAGNNIIVRYLRFRMGDRYQNTGMVPGSGHDDAFSGNGRSNVIIDHCSMSWSTDEVFSFYDGDSSTLQWNLIAEPLNYSYHFEKGDTDYENHGYGGIWGGKHLSAHHNLFAHCVSRNPRLQGIRNDPVDFVDYRNNVIYNWGENTVYGGEGGQYNIVNNYYRYGPSTRNSVKNRVVNPSRSETVPYGKFFVEGNYVDGFPEVTKDNRRGVVMGGKGSEEDKNATLVSAPFGAIQVNMQRAEQAYSDVLNFVGASLKRDTLDQRIINDVRNRTGRIIDVQGGYPHGTPYGQSASAWPKLVSAPAPADADKDGMPDEWEKEKGLNPADPSDASGIKLHSFYTNIEMYINSLVK